MSNRSIFKVLFFFLSVVFGSAVRADYSVNLLAGLEGGYARLKENFTTNFSDPTLLPSPVPPYVYQEYMLSNELLFMGGLAGAQVRCDRLMFGLEGSVDAHSLTNASPFVYRVVSSVFEGTAEYDRGPIYMLTGRVGYFVTPAFLPYVRAGAQFSRDEGTYQVFVPGGAVAGTAVQADFISSGKVDIWGFVLGIGMELPAMIGPSTFRIEYNYSRTQSITIADGTPPIFGTDTFYHPQTNMLKFAWVWNFI